MSGDHAKKEMVTGEKPATSHGKAPSREFGNKKKEGSPSRIRTHKSGEKKKICPIHPPLGDFQLVSEPGASLRA